MRNTFADLLKLARLLPWIALLVTLAELAGFVLVAAGLWALVPDQLHLVVAGVFLVLVAQVVGP